jgi:rhamnosyl/mannosyltransferase
MGYFIFIGVLRYYKGLDYLIEAAKDTSMQVVIVGSGPEEKRLRNLAKDLPNVRFLGFVSDEDKYALLRLAKAVVFPSHLRSEAFGVTLLEGALMSKPLITAEIGTGTSYVNSDGETGIVVPPADPNALRRAMELISVDQDLAMRMGAAARARYEKLFSNDKVAEKYYSLYLKLLERI